VNEARRIVELRRKLAAAHAELERRRRLDVEIAAHLPRISARLAALAAEVSAPVDPEPIPLEEIVEQNG